jgi:hypothetical protein
LKNDSSDHISVSETQLLAGNKASATYFNIEDFEAKAGSWDKIEFEYVIHTLWVQIQDSITVSQKQWCLDITRRTHLNGSAITKIHEWAIDITFDQWIVSGADSCDVPLISWFTVEKSRHDNTKIGVFAARRLHQVLEVDEDCMMNAKVCDTFLVRAANDIDMNQEIYFKHDNKVVW